MKKQRSLISLFLLLALLTALFVGCSSMDSGGYFSDSDFEPYTDYDPDWLDEPDFSYTPAETDDAGQEFPFETNPPAKASDWSVIGTINGTNWDTDFPMEETDGAYTLSLDLNAGDELKVRRDGSWDVNFGAFGISQGLNIVAPETGRYTVRLSFPDGPEAELELISERKNSRWSVIGSVNGTNWDVDFPMEEADEGVYTLEMELYTGDELKVRRDGEWDVSFGAGGILSGESLAVTENGTYTVRLTVYSESEADLELIPIPSSFDDSSGWSVIGTLNGTNWDADFPLHPMGSGRFQSDLMALHAGEEIKIRKDGSWDVNFGLYGYRDGENISIDKDGEYYVLFRLQEGDRPASIEILPVGFPELLGKIRELKADLEARYPLRICLHPDQNIRPDYAYVFGPEPMTVCRVLFDLEDFCASLPSGFLVELHDGTEAVPEPAGTKIMPGGRIRIFFVREVVGEAAAHAGMDKMYVCIATQEYDASHFPHEFMHLLDQRIQTILAGLGRDADAEWMALSPEGAYGEDFTDQQVIDDYFIYEYARRNIFEDRAVTFEYLYLSSEPLAEQDWYNGRLGVQGKVAYLVETIRELFPSVQAVSRAVWEKR